MSTAKCLFDAAKIIFVALLSIYIGFIVAGLAYHGFRFIHQCLQGAAIRSATEPWSAALAKLFYLGLAGVGAMFAVMLFVGVFFLLQSCVKELAFIRYLLRGGVPQFYHHWRADPATYERIAFSNHRQKAKK